MAPSGRSGRVDKSSRPRHRFVAATVAACAMLSGEAAGQQATWSQQDVTADTGSGFADPYAAPTGQEGDALQATGLEPATAIAADEGTDFGQQDYGRENLPQGPVDGQASRGASTDPTGIRVGTMILRPVPDTGTATTKRTAPATNPTAPSIRARSSRER